MDKVLFEALNNHLKDLQKKLYLQKVRFKVLTKQQHEIRTKVQRLQALYNREFSHFENVQNLSFNIMLNPVHSQKSIQSNGQVMHSVQHQQLLQQIKKLQVKIKNKESKMNKQHASNSIIKQDDEILTNLNSKLEKQESQLLTNIDEIIEIGVKINLNNQLKKRIKINQQLIFKAKQNPIMLKKVVQTNNKDIVRSGYTDRMIALIPKDS